MNNKKILLYGSGALVLGAVTYFVWSFFKKPIIPIGNTTVALGDGSKNEEETEEENIETTTSGSSTKYDFTPMQFEPLKTTDFNDISNFHLLMRNT